MAMRSMTLLAAAQITQQTVIWILVATTVLAIALLFLVGFIAWRTEQVLQYGNFFVVTLGIMAALIGFIIAFPLLVSNVFREPTQVLALLSALFGTIVGLVGTYFGVKASSDAREGAERIASGDTTLPLVSSVNPQPGAEQVPPETHVTATFSKDMDRATINTNTFKLIRGDTLATVGGRVGYNPPTKTATFQPSDDLEHGIRYQATITTDIKDPGSNALASERTWQFTVIP